MKNWHSTNSRTFCHSYVVEKKDSLQELEASLTKMAAQILLQEILISWLWLDSELAFLPHLRSKWQAMVQTVCHNHSARWKKTKFGVSEYVSVKRIISILFEFNYSLLCCLLCCISLDIRNASMQGRIISWSLEEEKEERLERDLQLFRISVSRVCFFNGGFMMMIWKELGPYEWWSNSPLIVFIF